MKRQYGFMIMLAVLLILALTLPLAAQEEAGVARVRIGYFAFDPRENDTYMDGELASFNAGWTWATWQGVIPHAPDSYWSTATPYFDAPAGVHSFAFVEDGGSLDTAFFSPDPVEFKSGHTYSLAITGHLELDDLQFLTIDETEAFAGIDPAANWRGNLINNIAGAPPIQVLVDEDMLIENLPYGEIVSYSNAAVNHHNTYLFLGDTPNKLTEFDYVDWPYLLELTAFQGVYPGEMPGEIFWAVNRDYGGELTLIDGGAVAIGDSLDGAIPAIAHRVAYQLNMADDASLSIYGRSAGMVTADTVVSWLSAFDPVLYVYDSEGRLLYWNDEQSWTDSTDNAALETLPLEAGDYTIQVGGFADLVGGPYELAVELAE